MSQPNRSSSLFEPFNLGDIQLKNRIVMAPLTRSKADEELVPTKEMAEYYARRGDAGLIITEATIISPDAQGYPNTPGLFTQSQIEGWQQVTEAVHRNQGKIFSQIWHTGRVSHSSYHNGLPPLAPSAKGLEGTIPRARDMHYETPRAMSQTDIHQAVDNFAAAARNANRAGFDGIEIHGANGYLIDQFLHWDSNIRTDEYGGSAVNMARFLIEIIKAVSIEMDLSRVGVRLSPQAYVHLQPDTRDKAVFDYLLKTLNKFNLAYVHTGIYQDDYVPALNATVTQYIRSLYHGVVIANGGYSPEKANKTIELGDADLVAIGRPFIANPDLIHRISTNQALVEYQDSMLEVLI